MMLPLHQCFFLSEQYILLFLLLYIDHTHSDTEIHN